MFNVVCFCRLVMRNSLETDDGHHSNFAKQKDVREASNLWPVAYGFH